MFIFTSAQILTYYALYYSHVKDFWLKFDYFIRVYSLVCCFVSVRISIINHSVCSIIE